VLAALDGRKSRLSLQTTVAYSTAGSDHVVAVHGSATAVSDFLRERLADRASFGERELRGHFTDMTRLLRRAMQVQPNDATSLDLFDAFLRSALPVLRRETASDARPGAEPQYSLRDRPPEGTRLNYEQRVTGSERRAVTLASRLDEIIGGALEGLEREHFIQIVCPTPTGGLAPVTRMRVARRVPPERSANGGEAQMRLVHAEGTIRSVAQALQPNVRDTVLAHAVINSDLVASRPLKVGSGRQWWLDDARINEDGGGGAVESLPTVGEEDARLWPDRRNPATYWYPPAFTVLAPVGNESGAASPFLFSYSSGANAAGEQTLDATVRFTLRAGMSAATAARLHELNDPPAKPVPTAGLSVALELPFKDEGGASKTQAVPAAVTQTGETMTVTVKLMGSWVRLCYGALAFPGFQQEPARLSIAYSFRAYVAAELDLERAVLGTIQKEALTPIVDSGSGHTPRDAPFFDASRGVYCFPGGELRYTREATQRKGQAERARRGDTLVRPLAVGVRPVGAGVRPLAGVRPVDSEFVPTRPIVATAVVAAPVVVSPVVVTPVLVQPMVLTRPGLLAGLRRNVERTVLRQERADVLFPCNANGAFYRQVAGATETQIGCRDALKLGQTTYQQYDELAELGHPLYRVYRSLLQPGRFLVVPTRYVITRYAATDPKRAYRPVILVYSTLDAERPEMNRVFFDATLQPDLPADARRALLARLASMAQQPIIEYPTEIASTVQYSWTVDARINVAPSVRQAPDSFQVTLATDIPGTLLLRSMLEVGGIHGGARFTLPDGSELSTQLLLELASITGPWPQGPVSVKVSGGTAQLRNAIERPVTVSELRLYSGVADRGSSLPVGVELPPEGKISVPLPGPAAEIVPVATVSAAGDATLEEIRTFVEDIKTNVIFIDLVNFANHQLKDFTVKARMQGIAGTRSVPLAAPTGGAAGTGRVGQVEFTLPLTTFLDKHLLQFQVTKVPLTGKKKSTAWIDWDLETLGNVVSIEWEMIK
jgi:hypothetical protein